MASGPVHACQRGPRYASGWSASLGRVGAAARCLRTFPEKPLWPVAAVPLHKARSLCAVQGVPPQLPQLPDKH